MAVTVRIDPAAHRDLAEIARANRLSLTEALSRAVETYRRQVFLEGAAADFAALRKDTGAWSDELTDRAAWDSTGADGLEGEPPHADARRGPRRTRANRTRRAPARARRR